MTRQPNRGQSPNWKSGSDPDFSFPATALRMSSGVIVWALHFAVVYGFTALACARGFGAAAPWAVGVATVVAALFAVVIIVRNLDSEFTRWISGALGGVALLAIIWEGLPVLMVADACA